jgi:hypothetical protein
MFVSNREGGCGGDDIYLTRWSRDGWAAPRNAGCVVNSVANEASPFRNGSLLYFSSSRAGGVTAEPPGAIAGDIDLYVSSILEDGSFGTPSLVPGVNSAANDARPNVRRDGRELFFDSDRAGGLGAFDVWSATRPSTDVAWSEPFNLGPNVNSVAAETRPWLSWDGTALYFGSVRGEPGPTGAPSQDIFVSMRTAE